MGFVDAIIEGIGNVLLLIIGGVLFFLGLFIMAASGAASAGGASTLGTIIGLIFVIVGLGLLAARYRRQ